MKTKTTSIKEFYEMVMALANIYGHDYCVVRVEYATFSSLSPRLNFHAYIPKGGWQDAPSPLECLTKLKDVLDGNPDRLADVNIELEELPL